VLPCALPEGDHETERAAQRQWITDRNAKRETWCSESRCVPGRDVKDCVTALYEARIAELQIKSGQVRVPAPVLYDCDNAETATVYFYNDTPIPAAVVNLGITVQDLAILHSAGSGARYEGTKLIFWTKGDTALLIRAGKPDVSCREKPRRGFVAARRGTVTILPLAMRRATSDIQRRLAA
jgi:membrane-bound inhibitor of C-type lysozyme